MAEETKTPLNSIQVKLSGNVVREPRVTPSKFGGVTVQVTLACNEVYNGKTPETWWCDCVFIRECAEVAKDYKQGDLIAVTGLLQPSRIKEPWTDKAGIERLSNDVCMVIPRLQDGGLFLPMQRRYRKPEQSQPQPVQNPEHNQVANQVPVTYMEAARQQNGSQEEEQMEFHMQQQLQDIITNDIPPAPPSNQQQNSYSISKQQPKRQQLKVQPKATMDTVVASQEMTKSDIHDLMN